MGADPGFSQGTAINNYGEVTGRSGIGYHGHVFDNRHAFRSTPNGASPVVLTDLGALYTNPSGVSASYGLSINAGGQVTGYSSTATGNHAFRTPATGDGGAMADLGTLGGTESEGRSINNLGQVTGYSKTVTGASHAFRTTSIGGIDLSTDLGTFLNNPYSANSDGFGINSQGIVVGVADVLNGTHAFVYTNRMIDLNDLLSSADRQTWHLLAAYSINDDGIITGLGEFYSNNQYFGTFGFRLKLPLSLLSMAPHSSVPTTAAQAITLSGTGFQADSKVYWNGNLISSVMVSPVQMTAVIPSGYLLAQGSYNVTVGNASSAGTSNALVFQVTQPQVEVTLNSLSRGTGNILTATIGLKNNTTGLVSQVKLSGTISSRAVRALNASNSPLSVSNINSGSSTSASLTFSLPGALPTGTLVNLIISGTFKDAQGATGNISYTYLNVILP